MHIINMESNGDIITASGSGSS